MKTLAALVLMSLVMLAVGSGIGSAKAGFTVDLGAGTVNGHTVLGLKISAVTAGFGKPSWRDPGARTYRIGYGERPNFSMMILFRKNGSVFRARSIAFERQPLREAKLSLNLLSMTPAAFARSITKVYRSTFRVTQPLACRHGVCRVTFGSSKGPMRFTFGRASGPLGTYLTIWTA